MSLRLGSLPIASRVTSLFVALAAAGPVLLGGCIARHRAPEEPVIASTPYAALALYRQILPPVAVGDPLPFAALRLAVGADGAVFADSAIVEGAGQARVAESWPEALALLGSRSEPVVLLLAAVADPSLCAMLEGLAPRVLRATRPTETPLYPLSERAPVPEGFSADPLVGHSLRADCPAP